MRALDLSPDRVDAPVAYVSREKDFFHYVTAGRAREAMMGNADLCPEMAEQMDAVILRLANDFVHALNRSYPDGVPSYVARGIALPYIATLLRETPPFVGMPDMLAKAGRRVRVMLEDGRLVETSGYPQIMGVGKVRPGRVERVRALAI